jgi:hypothetical protein
MSDVLSYAAIIQQFREAPPGKLYCLHGGEEVFRVSLAAAGHVLLQGVPLTLVDGTNRFDLYLLADFARRWGGARGPEDVLRGMYISRAFTCYQMEAVITERLPAFLRSSGSPVALIFGLLDTFYDDQAPLFEVRAGLERMIGALQQLKRAGTSVLLASQDIRASTPERNKLFPRLVQAMDHVVHLDHHGSVPTDAPAPRRLYPAQGKETRNTNALW